MALDAEKSGLTFGRQHVGSPLLTPDEVRNLPEHAELLFLPGNGRQRQRPQKVVGRMAQQHSSAGRRQHCVYDFGVRHMLRN